MTTTRPAAKVADATKLGQRLLEIYSACAMRADSATNLKWCSPTNRNFQDIYAEEFASELGAAEPEFRAALASRSPVADYHDAYRGARDDLQDWKNRALAAEESCRRLTAALNADNGPMFMGEPVPQPPQASGAPDVLSMSIIVGEAPRAWYEGVLMAASIVISCHDMPVVAATILNELGAATADCSGMDEFDKTSLRKLQGELSGGIALRGLSTPAAQATEAKGGVL